MKYSKFAMLGAWSAWLLLAAQSSRAQCTLTNSIRTPLPEMGLAFYHGYTCGLYPGGANNRPPDHLAAGIEIAMHDIEPRNRITGDADSTNGAIVLLSVGMSNTTHEFGSGSNDGLDPTAPFKYRADRDRSKNPRLIIIDGAQGGQDVTRWTNITAQTWTNVFTRLNQAGVSTQQVQAVWLKESLQNITQYGVFPAHALELQRDLEIVVRNLKILFPHIAICYVSSRTRCYTTNSTATNPEPYSWEVGFSTKWMIERQISGAADLNFDSTRGAVVAPYICWGPYLWTDAEAGRSDGLVGHVTDVVSDCTHPSSIGVRKVSDQLLAFFKTDPTARTWFLRQTNSSQAPTCNPTADATNGVTPLVVHFAANSSIAASTNFAIAWTFDDSEFSTNANPTKRFRAPGVYQARLTVSDNFGNTASSNVTITALSSFDSWQQAKFSSTEITNSNISGPLADPDGDGIANQLEYLLGLEPKIANTASDVLPRAAIENGYFTLTFTRYKFASDLGIEVDISDDLKIWNSGEPFLETRVVADNGLSETVSIRDARLAASVGQAFLRTRVVGIQP